MKLKVISLYEDFFINKEQSFFNRYSVQSSADYAETESSLFYYLYQQDILISGNMKLSLLEDNHVFVESFYPRLNTPLKTNIHYEKGDSAYLFYLLVDHFFRHFNLPQSSKILLSSFEFTTHQFYLKLDGILFKTLYIANQENDPYFSLEGTLLKFKRTPTHKIEFCNYLQNPITDEDVESSKP